VGWRDVPPTCGKGIKIGMIDSGVDTSHPVLKGQDIEFRSFHSENASMGDSEHGTAVAALLVGSSASAALTPAQQAAINTTINAASTTTIADAAKSALVAGGNNADAAAAVIAAVKAKLGGNASVASVRNVISALVAQNPSLASSITGAATGQFPGMKANIALAAQQGLSTAVQAGNITPAAATQASAAVNQAAGIQSFSGTLAAPAGTATRSATDSNTGRGEGTIPVARETIAMNQLAVVLSPEVRATISPAASAALISTPVSDAVAQKFLAIAKDNKEALNTLSDPAQIANLLNYVQRNPSSTVTADVIEQIAKAPPRTYATP